MGTMTPHNRTTRPRSPSSSLMRLYRCSDTAIARRSSISPRMPSASSAPSGIPTCTCCRTACPARRADSPAPSLKYIDSVETDTHVYIATERVRPLLEVMREWDAGAVIPAAGKGKGKERAKEEWIAWGIQSVVVRAAAMSRCAVGLINPPLRPPDRPRLSQRPATLGAPCPPRPHLDLHQCGARVAPGQL